MPDDIKHPHSTWPSVAIIVSLAVGFMALIALFTPSWLLGPSDADLADAERPQLAASFGTPEPPDAPVFIFPGAPPEWYDPAGLSSNPWRPPEPNLDSPRYDARGVPVTTMPLPTPPGPYDTPPPTPLPREEADPCFTYVAPDEPPAADYFGADGRPLGLCDQVWMPDLQVGMPICRINYRLGTFGDYDIVIDAGTTDGTYVIRTVDGSYRDPYLTDDGLEPYPAGWNPVNRTVYGTCFDIMSVNAGETQYQLACAPGDILTKDYYCVTPERSDKPGGIELTSQQLA